MTKKTDWQVARGLADFICSLGEFKHDVYKDGVKQPYGSGGVSLYVDGKYVSCSIVKDGKETMPFDCFDGSFVTPNICETVQNFSDIKFPDLKKLNRVYRRMLKPMVETSKARLEQQKKEKIKQLKEELKTLKEDN